MVHRTLISQVQCGRYIGVRDLVLNEPCVVDFDWNVGVDISRGMVFSDSLLLS